MKKCIHYLLGRCEFVITLKFALIIPLSCKAMMYIGSMENGHANINFMLYLCHLFVTCVILSSASGVQPLSSVLDPRLWPSAFWFQRLAAAAGLWPLTSSPLSASYLVQEIKPLHRRPFEHKVKASIESCLGHIQTFITFSSITE